MSSARLFRRIPWFVVVWTFCLMAIGLAAIVRGDELGAGGELWPRQLVWIVLAVAAMFAGTLSHYRVLRDISYPLFFGCLVLLGLVYLTAPRNGSHRWIPLGLFDFQPSELTKLAFIMALSNYLIHRRNYRALTGLLVPFVIALIPVALILREPDLGTSLVFLPVLFAMLFAAGAAAAFDADAVPRGGRDAALVDGNERRAEVPNRDALRATRRRTGCPRETGIICTSRNRFWRWEASTEANGAGPRSTIPRHTIFQRLGPISSSASSGSVLDSSAVAQRWFCISCCLRPGCGLPPARGNRLADCWPSASSR